MLDMIGIGSDRLEMYFCSAAEGAKFSEIAKEITAKISEMGPSPLKLKTPAEAEGSS